MKISGDSAETLVFSLIRYCSLVGIALYEE